MVSGCCLASEIFSAYTRMTAVCTKGLKYVATFEPTTPDRP